MKRIRVTSVSTRIGRTKMTKKPEGSDGYFFIP